MILSTFRLISFFLLIVPVSLLLARGDTAQPYMLLVDGTSQGRQLFMMSEDGSWRENVSRTHHSVNYYGPSSDKSWLIFESGNSPWGMALYRVRINGGMKEQLLAEEDFSHYRFMQPGLAPDGRRLAYFRLTGNSTALHILAEHNQHIIHQLPLDSITDNTIWTSDGRWILFLGSVDRELYLFRADNNGFERMLQLDSPVRFDNLLPNGNWLAVQSNTGYFALINIETARIERLRGDIIEFLGWSPDSTQFYFRNEDGIAVSAISAPHVRHAAEEPTYVSLSPFRSTVTFTESNGTHRIRDREGREQYLYSASDDRYFASGPWHYFVDGDVYRQHSETSEVQRLTDLPNNKQIITWSPDKKWLYFTTNADIYTQVMYRMRPDGSDIQEVTRHSSVVSVSLAPGGFITWIQPPEHQWNILVYLLGYLVLLVGSRANSVYNRLN